MRSLWVVVVVVVVFVVVVVVVIVLVCVLLIICVYKFIVMWITQFFASEEQSSQINTNQIL